MPFPRCVSNKAYPRGQKKERQGNPIRKTACTVYLGHRIARLGVQWQIEIDAFGGVGIVQQLHQHTRIAHPLVDCALSGEGEGCASSGVVILPRCQDEFWVQG